MHPAADGGDVRSPWMRPRLSKPTAGCGLSALTEMNRNVTSKDPAGFAK